MKPDLLYCALIAVCTVSPASAKAVASAHAAKPLPSPPYSFLPTQPDTLQGVMRQLEANPRLQDRYANHFHTSRQNVMAFFRTNLVESVIPATRPYTVWMAHRDGKKYAKLKTMRKGQRVLALRDGTPVLHPKCGNPFLSHIKYVPKPYRRAKVKPSSESRRRYASMVTPFEGETGYLSEAPFELPFATTFADVPMSVMRSHRLFVPFWWRNGGGGGAAIPEPGSLALLAAGSLSLLPLIRRRRTA